MLHRTTLEHIFFLKRLISHERRYFISFLCNRKTELKSAQTEEACHFPYSSLIRAVSFLSKSHSWLFLTRKWIWWSIFPYVSFQVKKGIKTLILSILQLQIGESICSFPIFLSPNRFSAFFLWFDCWNCLYRGCNYHKTVGDIRNKEKKSGWLSSLS